MKTTCSRNSVRYAVARCLSRFSFYNQAKQTTVDDSPHRTTPPWFSGAFAVLLLLGAQCASAATINYDTRLLSSTFSPVAVNERGWIAGQSLYSPYGAALYAGRLRTITPGSAYGLNNEGVVVGEYTSADNGNRPRAFRAAPPVSSEFVDLGVLDGGNASAAYAINKSGKAVGYSNAPVSAESAILKDHAVVFKDGKIIDQGYFAAYDGVGAYARGINDAGVIVGAFKKSDGTYRPFQIIDGYGYPLNGFEQDNAQAISINNNGCIIGNITLSDGSTRAFLYERGQRKDIVPEGSGATRAYGQNDLGQIVGEYKVTNTQGALETRAFVFDNGVFMDMQSLLPATFTQIFTTAYAINNHGAIVARTSYGIHVVSPRVAVPMIQHPALPLPRLPGATDNFGTSVAVSGNLAVAGAPGEQNNRGAAYVYRFDGKLWRQEARLVVKDAEAGLRLGERVAIDGDTVVVTTVAKSAAYVFRRSGATWMEPAKLVPETTGSTNYGSSVTVSGSRIVVGAPYENVTVESAVSYYSGAVYVFDWDGEQWVRTRLTAPEPLTYGTFGSAIALQGDVLVIGEPWPCMGYCYCYYCNAWRGRAYVYTYESGAWRKQTLNHQYPVLYDTFGSSIDIAGDTLVVGGSSTASIYKRVDSAAGSEWIEQDWIAIDASYNWTSHRLSIDGDEIAVGATDINNTSYARLYRRVGRVWDDSQRYEPANRIAANALVYRGKMLMFAAATGAGSVVPMTICPEPVCADTAVADLSVTVDAPSSALIAEGVTHTVTVTNHHPEHTVSYLATRSEFVASSGGALNWMGAPGGCVASPALGRVDCVVRNLGPGQTVRLDLHLAAPPLSGTLKHNVTVQHIGPDPQPGNNSASAEMAVVSSGQPRIEIYAPHQNAIVRLAPGQNLELAYDILGFDVGENDNVFTLAVDSGKIHVYTTQQTIALEMAQQGPHTLTFKLVSGGTTVNAVKTVNFYVEIEAPDVVIDYPRNGSTVYCRRDEPVRPHVNLNYWPLGEASRELQTRIDGAAFGGAVAAMTTFESIDLCALPLDATHSLSVDLRYGNTGDTADSDSVTFDVRKAAPQLTLVEPVDGNSGYARDGFAMIYSFEHGYDPAVVSVTLNGTALAGPLPTDKTSSVELPQALLRDGENELAVTVTGDSGVVQTSTARFYTQPITNPPKSKGGMFGLWAILVLALLATARRR